MTETEGPSVSPQPPMSLYVWPGSWGSPSVCQDCVAVMAYCKFAKVNIAVISHGNPWSSPTGSMPALTHTTGASGEESSVNSTSGVSEIIDYLRKHNLGSDHDLTASQSADVYAYNAMLQDKLYPALDYLWWVDTNNFVEVTRPQYAKILPFPLGMIIPSRTRSRHQGHVEASRPAVFSDKEWQNKIYKSAKECLNILSEKLGDQEYFFGSSPVSFDAVVFGCLVPILKAPVTDAVLKNHLKASNNLMSFIGRIMVEYFPLTGKDKEESDRQQAEALKKEVGLHDFPHRRRNLVIGGLVALAGMATYAVLSGLVQVEVVSSRDDAEEEEEGEEGSQPKPPNFGQFDKMYEEGNEQEEEE